MAELVSKYKQYAEYKYSGVEWLDVIPSHWSESSLKYHLKSIVAGGTPESSNDSYWALSGEGIPWVSIADMSRSFEVHKTNKDVSVKGKVIKNLKVVPKDTILYSIFASLGKVAIAKVPLVTNQAILGLEPISNLYSSYLVYWLKYLEPYLSLYSTSNTQDNLNTEKVGNLPLLLTDLDEQTQIANFLDHETAQIDTLIEKQQTLIQLLKEKRQAVISHAVTKGLNPDAPMKDSGVEWLGEVPEHWGVTRIKYITSMFEQGWSPQCDSRPAESNEYGVLKVGCVNYGSFHSSENKALPPELQPRLQYVIEKGDLLISRANTKELVGSAAIVDTDYDNLLLCDKLYRLRFNSNIQPELISLYLSIEPVREQIELQASGASSSMQNISQDVIKELPCFLLPNQETYELLKFINEKMEVFDGLVMKAKQAIQLMQERRTALISAAVTGKIDVRGWQAHAVGAL